MKFTVLALTVLSVFATGSLQQAPPATEVYLAPLPPTAGGVLQIINISNNPGYDNQPSFLPDSSAVLFSSNRDGKQTDIYRYDIATKELKQVTTTPEAEYSPIVTPDRKTFSAVRVEADNTQRLWRFDLDGSNPRVILENVKPVGYHAWIDETHLALFILGSGGGAPATLQLADTKTGTATVAATGIGRSILMRPKMGTVSYVSTADKPAVIKELDLKTGNSATLIAPLDGSQDAAWLPDGRLIMARDNSISMWRPGSSTWEPMARIASGPANINRLAVSPAGKWLAFVDQPPR